MRTLLSFFFWFCFLAVPVVAYEVTVAEPTEPYAVVDLATYTGVQELYLGNLNDFPIMYEFSVSEEQVLRAELSQRYTGKEPIKFSLIVVRIDDNTGSVKEVVRLNPTSDDWRVERDRVIGMTFWRGPKLEETLATGTYRVEVSTPDNQGKYGLLLGTVSSDAGYFATLGTVRTVQKFFGHTFFRLLASSYVYYPLGILLLIFGLRKTWQYRKLITNGS